MSEDNTPATVRLGEHTYEIKPISLLAGIRLTNLIRSYLARSGGLMDVLMAANDGEGGDEYKQLTAILTILNQVVPDDVFEHDLVLFLYLISSIPEDDLREAGAEEMVGELPQIIAASRFIPLITRLISTGRNMLPTAAAPPAPTAIRAS